MNVDIVATQSKQECLKEEPGSKILALIHHIGSGALRTQRAAAAGADR